MESSKRKILDLIVEDYFRVKELLNKRPMRLNMFTYMDDDFYDNLRKNSGFNIFNDYHKFLDEINELSEDEKRILNTKANKFINCLEKTHMTRSYKIPLLLAFYNNGNMKFEINEDDIYLSFKDFYNRGTNGFDLLQDAAGKNYRNWTRSDYLKIAKNPQDAFLNSAKEFFTKKKNNYCINEDLKILENNSWFLENFKDVIDFKTRSYYKNRLIEKYSKGQIEIKYALRDEKVNIFAITEGKLQSRFDHQFFICKKQLIPDNREIFLLDAKKSNTVFMLSDMGKQYAESIKGKEYRHNYVGLIDCQMKILISKQVFEDLYNSGYFTIWEPKAPLKYFEGLDEGYLVIFRVYRIKDSIDEEILEKGRSGRNFFYKTTESMTTRFVNPVIDDSTFNKMKEELINLLKRNNYFISIN